MGALDFFKHFVRPNDSEAAEMRHAAEEERKLREQMLAEQRTAPRVAMQASVSVHSETNFFTGFTENVSEGGVFIVSLCPPEVGSELDVDIAVGDTESRRFRGRVAWIRSDENGQPSGCGVQFIDVTPEQAEALDRMVSSADRDPLFYDV